MKSIRLDSSSWEAQKSKLRAHLESRMSATKTALHDALHETGAEVAEDLSARTFPSANAIGLAVGAMRFDLSRVYCSGGKAFEILKGSSGPSTAMKFYANWKRGDLSAARQILRSSGSPIANIIIGEPLNPALRETVRDKNGRVMTAYPLQICHEAEIAAHAKLAIQEIGKTAAGWSACAEELGGDGGAIRWKSTAQHGSDGGKVEWSEDDFGVHLLLHNLRPLAKKHISPGQVASILARAREKLSARMRQSSALRDAS